MESFQQYGTEVYCVFRVPSAKSDKYSSELDRLNAAIKEKILLTPVEISTVSVGCLTTTIVSP